MEDLSESLSQDGETICTVCGFCAKCPRSLKIHYARKHVKKKVPDDFEADANLIQNHQSENQEDGPSQNKKPTNEEDTHTQERRISKRTPKPKIIHSCNYCGQEFRDKEPLDIHIQRYHTKDVPYTCKYLFFNLFLLQNMMFCNFLIMNRHKSVYVFFF